ncbi:MAG: hypothetical protein HC857_08655 [Synechococcales cyanobacterium RU_4_20]|nr:hypothetical protein [Synechococcales cyanobacterium RU_4_20]NJR68886.1 hypothetical protein [Synechococcales cyanobacterium CRU_2_2]
MTVRSFTVLYPIILYPHALTIAWSQKPATPTFHGLEPCPPPRPQGINWKLILVEMALTSLAAVFFGLLGFCLGLVVTITQVLLEQDAYRRRRRRFYLQVDRYEKELKIYLDKEANHRIYCEASQGPQSIAAYQYQLVLAALKTTQGYDVEIGYDIKKSVARREAAEEFLEPYLNKYFPGKILTKAALSYSGFQDVYAPKFAYVDIETGLHINLEIDQPYILKPGSKTGQPIHYLGDQKDGDRNDFFLEKNWLVIRFTEEQVMRRPQSCCKVIAREIFKITAQSGLMERFERVADLPEQPQWTWAEAEAMAQQQYRLSYLSLDVEPEGADAASDSRELLKQASLALLELGT